MSLIKDKEEIRKNYFCFYTQLKANEFSAFTLFIASITRVMCQIVVERNVVYFIFRRKIIFSTNSSKILITIFSDFCQSSLNIRLH